ncbi:MAG: GAF domain-containing protein [Elusimicrobia bacterium]|nr:GAF domain-containing protein [Elusimicrobiota bacterium]
MKEKYFEQIHIFVSGFKREKFETPDEIWDFLIRKASSIIGCHAATFFEADEAKKNLSIKKSIGPVAKDISRISFGYQGIVGWCAETREPIIANEVEKDPRFSKNVDYGTGFKTKSIIAVPCVYKDRLYGIVELINPVVGAFTEDDLKLVGTLCLIICQAVAIKELESALKQMSLKGENTINNLSGGFIGVDLDLKITFFNPKAREIFEVGEEYLNKGIIDFYKACPDAVNIIGEVLKNGKTVRRQEFKCVVNGKTKTIGYSSITMKGVDGNMIGAGMIFQDITNV